MLKGTSGNCIIPLVGVISLGCAILIILPIIAISMLGYNFGGGDSGGGGASGSYGSATPVTATTWDMPSTVLDKIKAKKSAYQEVATKYKMPWQLLAAVNYRECSLRDCGPSGEEMGEVNPDSDKVECPISAGYPACLGQIASHLQSLSKGVYDVTLSESSNQEEIIKAMVAYNRGYLYKRGGCSVNDSPYAWNQFDDAHKNMRFPNNSCEPSSVRGKLNIPAGGFTIYSYLLNNSI